MMNDSAYWGRKHEEINLLQSCLDEKKSLQIIKEDNVQLYFERKVKMTNQLRAFFFENSYITNTNFCEEEIENEVYKYSYSYMRYDSKVDFKSYKIYPNLKMKCRIYLTNCGMSAIHVVLLAISAIGQFNIICREDIYFETLKLMCSNNMFTRKKKRVSFLSNILYLDSISNCFVFDERIINKHIKLIIIDTTCFFNEEYNNIQRYAIKREIPIILVRSHTKLDMLGSEYSRLGSICICRPPGLNDETIYTKLIEKIEFYLPLAGVIADASMIPPFWKNNFVNINLMRINNIKMNCEKISLFLKNNISFDIVKKFVEPTHELFVLIILKHKIGLDVLKDKLKYLCKKTILPIKYAGSFGFDFIAIDTYWCEWEMAQAIRISAGDLPEMFIEKCMRYFVRWINENLYD